MRSGPPYSWVEFKKQLTLTFSTWTREIFVLLYAWTPPNPLQPWWVIHSFPHHHLRLLGLFTLLLTLLEADRTSPKKSSSEPDPNWFHLPETASGRGPSSGSTKVWQVRKLGLIVIRFSANITEKKPCKVNFCDVERQSWSQSCAPDVLQS